MQVLAEVTDDSGVANVEFFLDGVSLGESAKAPHRTSFKVPEKMGRHELTVKAADSQGNKAEKTIPITVTRESVIDKDSPFIASAEKNFRTLSASVTFPDPNAVQAARLVVTQQGQTLSQTEWTRHDGPFLDQTKLTG